MIASLLIALAAGAASALMFASIISGALISILLVYLAPLPLMVAALGWGPLTSAIGGIAAGVGLGLLFGLPFLAIFVLSIALPAWWLGHLALLGRPAAAGMGTGTTPIAAVMEWYPVGRLLLWIAGFAALTTIAALLTFGMDSATILAGLRRGLTRMMGARGASPSGDASQLVDLLVMIAPAAAAIVAIMTLTLNLFLAAKITATSGRMQRAWPDLSSAALPPMTLVALCLALAFSFVGGLIAIVAQIVSAALLMAYALTGFATLHTLTRGRRHRMLWLSAVYAVVMVFGWPVLAMMLLGLADAIFGFRHAGLRRTPPPGPVS